MGGFSGDCAAYIAKVLVVDESIDLIMRRVGAGMKFAVVCCPSDYVVGHSYV